MIYKFHCSSCKKYKKRREFSKCKSRKYGLSNICSKCHKLYLKNRYRNDVIFRENNKYRARKWQKENPEARKDNVLQRIYGITIEAFHQLEFEQDYKCWICKKKMSGSNTCVDHDKQSKKIRGLLCQFCNRGLGNFYDDIESLHRAIKYLEE